MSMEIFMEYFIALLEIVFYIICSLAGLSIVIVAFSALYYGYKIIKSSIKEHKNRHKK